MYQTIRNFFDISMCIIVALVTQRLVTDLEIVSIHMAICNKVCSYSCSSAMIGAVRPAADFDY